VIASHKLFGRAGEESKCLLGQECDEYGEPVVRLEGRFWFGCRRREVGQGRERAERVERNCRQELRARSIGHDSGGKKRLRVRSTGCLSARLMAHEHTDSDGLWLAEGVQDE